MEGEVNETATKTFIFVTEVGTWMEEKEQILLEQSSEKTSLQDKNKLGTLIVQNYNKYKPFCLKGHYILHLFLSPQQMVQSY